MTNDEFAREFDIIYENINSGSAPGLEPYEKSVMLTGLMNDITKMTIDEQIEFLLRGCEEIYTKDELQFCIERRNIRTDLRKFKTNTEIAGRPYQIESVQRIAENFVTMDTTDTLKGRSRESLLVMATGSGKTRVSCAIVDMLTKCNWAKRILFLADRNSLVTQAKNAFNEHLPNLSSIDLT